MRRFSFIGILTFLGLFVYFYKTSGKFRKSITTALFVAFMLSSGPLESEAKVQMLLLLNNRLPIPIGIGVFLVVQQ